NLEVEMDGVMDRDYSLEEKQLLDSIDKALQFQNKSEPSSSFPAPPIQVHDYNTPASIPDTNVDLEDIDDPTLFSEASSSKYDDPMVLFREQMKVIDSIS